MKKIFEDFNEYMINEGVYDKCIFKAFYLAGGPGSGKSYVVDHSVAGLGLKLVNSDTAFKYFLKKEKLNLNITSLTKDDYDTAMKIRKNAKNLTEKKVDLYLDGRLGMVFDGTGKDYNKITKSAEIIKSYGYDTYMIFVNTSLPVALERNNQRDRVVPIDVVKKSWFQVQSNIGKFQNYFGLENFILIDNNNADEDIFIKVHKRIKKLINNPIKNYVAKEWIKKELENKKRS